MIQFLDPNRFYTSRHYLRQWFDHKTLVTDNDFENTERTQQLLKNIPVEDRIVDITHNPLPDSRVCVDSSVILTNNFARWYTADSTFRFFPLFLWAYSLRKTLWWEDFVFDASTNKSQKFMCLNNQTRDHRTRLYQLLSNTGTVQHITYSMDRQGLANEPTDPMRNDIGVGHPVYSQTAVNIVTETFMDWTYLSEKTCKPFVAQQIPIIVGPVGTNKFLSDIGLDMFEDLVPWAAWDSETDTDLRLQRIALFISQWVNAGTALDDYQRVQDRVQANKRYFHSEAFRNRIMVQMDTLV